MSENNILPDDVQKAWDAYQEMKTSKQEYFSFLQELDKKYENSGSPSIAENLKLEQQLKAHDEKVFAFNDAMQAIENKESREILLNKLSEDAAKIGKQ